MPKPFRYHVPLGGAAVGCAALMLSQTAAAAGFGLTEQGVANLGNANAGASANAWDAATVWWNPAGMTALKQRQLLVGAHVLGVDTSFEDRGSTLSPALGATQISGQTSDQPGGATAVPNIYYVHPLNAQLTLGVGVSVPFGSSTEYDRDWVGRYLTVESGISVIDINPSIAYRVNDRFSIGGGISLQSLSATLGNAVDSGATCLGISARDPASLPASTCVNLGLLPDQIDNDSYAEVEGDSTAVSFNLGARFSPSPATHLGVSYRHSSNHELEGDAAFTVNPALGGILAAASLPLFQNGGASTEVELPSSIALSVAHQATPELQLLGDITWTGWSSVQEIRITFDNPAQPESFTTLAWEDTVRVSAGLNYTLNNQWTLRAGLAFDQEAIPGPQQRTPRVPGNDRTWIAVGAGYNMNANMGFDFGYVRLVTDETPIDNTGDASGAPTLRGVYDSAVNILGAQFNWRFN